METIQKATLVLKTCDLPPLGTRNEVGSVNDDRTSLTWYNVNLKLLLGDMYDKYDLFNLKLNAVSMSNQALNINSSTGAVTYLFGSEDQDRTVFIEMIGLPFINNTYDTKLNSSTASSILGIYKFDYNTSCVQYNDNAIVTFSKGSGISDITLQYKTVYDGDFPIVGVNGVFPQMIFHFSIYGIPRVREPDQIYRL